MDEADGEVFDTPGLVRLFARVIDHPGLSDMVPSVETLRELMIGPQYAEPGNGDGWHEVGVYLLIRTALRLEHLTWTAPWAIEVERAFVGRGAGRLRALHLVQMSEILPGFETDYPTVLTASVDDDDIRQHVARARAWSLSPRSPRGPSILPR